MSIACEKASLSASVSSYICIDNWIFAAITFVNLRVAFCSLDEWMDSAKPLTRAFSCNAAYIVAKSLLMTLSEGRLKGAGVATASTTSRSWK